MSSPPGLCPLFTALLHNRLFSLLMVSCTPGCCYVTWCFIRTELCSSMSSCFHLLPLSEAALGLDPHILSWFSALAKLEQALRKTSVWNCLFLLVFSHFVLSLSVVCLLVCFVSSAAFSCIDLHLHLSAHSNFHCELKTLTITEALNLFDL